MQVQVEKKLRNPAKVRCQIGLLIFLVLGALLVVSGVWGINQYNASGFDQEAGYTYIHQLSPQVDKLYENGILPQMNALEATEKIAIEQRSRELLAAAWTDAAKEDRSALVDTYISSADDAQEAQMKLLSVTYSVAGPKVSSKEKKALAAMGDAERGEFRLQMLRGMIDDAAVLPEVAANAVEGEEDLERDSILMQMFLTSVNADNEPLPTESVNGLKKAVRNADARITAYQKTVDGSVSWLSQLLLSNTRTVILAGIMLMLDVVLLFFLLKADGSWHMDFKWIVILIIVDFLLIFQVMSLVYLVI